jgi:hypothetical protein
MGLMTSHIQKPGVALQETRRELGAIISKNPTPIHPMNHTSVPPANQNVWYPDRAFANETHEESTRDIDQDDRSSVAISLMPAHVRMDPFDQSHWESAAYQESHNNSPSQEHEANTNVHLIRKQLAYSVGDTSSTNFGAYKSNRPSPPAQSGSTRNLVSGAHPPDVGIKHNSYPTQARPMLTSGPDRSRGIVNKVGVIGSPGAGSSGCEESLMGNDSIARPRLVREVHQSSQTPGNHLRSMSEDAITIENLKAKVRKHKRECAQVRKMWQTAVDDLAFSQQGSTPESDDQPLRTAYEEMLIGVQRWAATYCHLDPKPKLSTRTKTHLKRLTPAWTTFISRSGTCFLLIQSVIMNWLFSEVLTCDVGVGIWWAGKLQEGLSTLFTQIDPGKSIKRNTFKYSLFQAKGISISSLLNNGHLDLSYVREYAAWRARTAGLVSKLADKKHIEANVTTVSAELESFLTPFVIAEKKEDAWLGLRAIVRHTFILDEDSCKSGASFNAYNWDGETVLGWKFDETIMESPTGSSLPHSGMTVSLVLAPALTKMGTADGDIDGKISFISKWIVICSEPPGTDGQNTSLVSK